MVERQPGRPIPVATWYSLAVLTLAGILSYVDRQLISLLVGSIKRDLGISDVKIGLAQGLGFGLFYAMFGLPVGWLVDRYSRRNIIYVGMTLWSLATAACGMAHSFSQLLLARFGVGIGEASLYPSAFSIIADLFPPRRLATATGIFATCAASGAVIAYIGGGRLIQHLEQVGPQALPLLGTVQPWQIVFLIIGLPSVFAALLILTIREPQRPARPASSNLAGLWRLIMSEPRFFACHFIGFGFMGVLSYGAAAWVPTMLIRRYGMGIAEVGLFLGSTVTICGMIGYVASGWATDLWFSTGTRDAHMRYFMWSNLASAILAPVALMMEHRLAVALPIFFFIHFLQPAHGPAIAQLQIVTPRHLRGQMSALFLVIFNLMGLCIGPVAIGVLTDDLFRDPMKVHYSLTMLYSVVAFAAALVFALGLPAARHAMRRIEEGESDAASALPDSTLAASIGFPA